MPKGRRKLPKDTGMMPFGISEAERDRLSKRDWTKPDPKNDPKLLVDNWTTKECEEKLLSGIRVNKLNGLTEIWAVGRILKTGKTEYIGKDPSRLASLLEEAFQTGGSIVAVDVSVKRLPFPETPKARGKKH